MTSVVLANGKRYESPEGMSMLDAALAAGLVLEHSCRTGRCSSCKAHVTHGATVQLRPEEGLTAGERADGIVLTCVRAAKGDSVSLDVDDLGELAHVPRSLVPCRIRSIERITDDVVKVILRLPPSASLRYLPGQYVQVIGSGGLRRSYSIANADPTTGIELHIGAVDGGAMSAFWFGAAKVDDLLRLDGPLGTFFLRPAAGEDMVFLATGTGIAPIKAMLEHLADWPTSQRPAHASLYWGCRREREHYWQPSAGLVDDYVPVVSRPDLAWVGAHGHVQDAFLATSPDLSRTWVYACGSSAMIRAAQTGLVALGLPPRRFLSDAFVPSN